MSSKRQDVPPSLKDSADFEEWMRDVKIWQHVTDLDKKKQGPVLYRSLEGQAKKACSNLAIEELCGDEGVNLLTNKLKELFAKDEDQLTFEAIKKFENFRRTTSMTVKDYLAEFERLKDGIEKYDVNMPDVYMAYKLLLNSNIGEEKQTMCRATMGKMTYDNVRKQLKAIHDVTGKDGSEKPGIIKVKEEPVFEAETEYSEEEESDAFYGRFNQRGYNSGYRGRGRNRGRGDQRHNWRDKKVRFKDDGKRERKDDSKSKYEKNETKAKNPVGRDGLVTRCAICKSAQHYAFQCGKKKRRGSNEEEEEEIGLFTISLFTSKAEREYLPEFLKETLNHAVLDCGCVKSVCGRKWLEIYLDSLSKKDASTVQQMSSNAKFRFGASGPLYSSTKRMKFPGYLGKIRVMLEADVIESDIPLLLSKESMKKAATQIDFLTDKVIMLGEQMPIKSLKSGHYAVPLSKFGSIENGIAAIESVFLTIEDLDHKAKRKACLKLHSQFGHPTKERLLKLIEDASIKDKDLTKLIGEISEKCGTCNRFKSIKLRPVVGMSLSKDFNDMIAMDLKPYKGVHIFHMIDLATRFSAGTVIRNKRQETIVEGVFKHWVSIFGAPNRLLSDNGNEFNNNVFRSMGELLNAEVQTTGAYSPWSNGVTERHNAVIGNMLDKITEERKCSIEMALCWALSSKNALSNVYGYSPNVLVFGRNPNLPSVLKDKLPALENVTASHVVADHLNAMHSARKAFIEAESSEKIKRALRRKVRPATSLIFETGDKVMYKRNNGEPWKGPGKVIGKEKHQVFVKHGGVYVRVNPCHLRHAEEESMNWREDCERNEEEEYMNWRDECERNWRDSEGGYSESESCRSESYDSDSSNEWTCSDAERDETEVHENENEDQESEISDNDDTEENEIISSEESEYSETIQEEVITSTDNDTEAFEDNEISNSEEEIERQNGQCVNGNGNSGEIRSVNIPKKGTKIRYKMSDDVSTKEALVLGRCGKVNGKNKYWINVEHPDKTLGSLNTENMESLEEIEEEVFLTSSRSSDVDVLQAMTDELDKWKDMDVYEAVHDEGQSCISTRWVITEKYKEGKKVVKARLVARGFEENNLSSLRKDSPTCGKDCLRLIFTIIASHGWKINALDVKAAFLQGRMINRDIYILPPKEAKSSMLWKLRKTVYGLSDASRKWYLRVKDALLEAGVSVCKYDEAIFIWRCNGVLSGILCSHVDDFFYGGTEEFKSAVIDKIKEKFSISQENVDAFVYLGLQIKQDENEIRVNQQHYIDSLDYIYIDTNKSNSTVLNDEEKRKLRCAAGQLNWVTSQTRPDLAYDSCLACVSLKDATMKDVRSVNKSLKKLKLENVKLHFRNIGNIPEAEIVTHCDASYRNLKGENSQGAFVMFLVGKNGSSSILTWQSKKVKRVVKSTLAAEALSLDDAADASIYIRAILCEIYNMADLEMFPITIYTDNKNLFESANSTGTLEDKRLKLDICSIREKLNKRDISEINWIPKEFQLADSLTKNEASRSQLLRVLEDDISPKVN